MINLSSRFERHRTGIVSIVGLAAALLLDHFGFLTFFWWGAMGASGLTLVAMAMQPAPPVEEVDAAKDWPKADRRMSSINWTQIAELLEGAAKGELEDRIFPLPTEELPHRVARDVNHLLDVTEAFVREFRGVSHALLHGNTHRVVLEQGMEGHFRETAHTNSLCMQEIGRKVTHLDAMTRTFEARVLGVAHDVSTAASDMKGTATDLSATVQSTSQSASVIAEQAVAASGAVEKAAEIASAMEPAMASARAQTSVSAQNAQNTVDIIEQASGAIASLSDNSSRIREVVAIIQNVADSINLLAVNAAVEAARAGTAGKGFAVVASEIQSLATDTATATREVSEQVKSVQTGVENAVASFASIGDSVKELVAIVSDVQDRVSEQQEAITDLAVQMTTAARGTRSSADLAGSISDAVSRNATVVAQITASSGALMDRAEDLEKELSTYLQETKAA